MMPIAYINDNYLEGLEDFEARVKQLSDKESMFSGIEICREEPSEDQNRAYWNYLQANLKSGDTIVIPSLKNVMENQLECVDFLVRCTWEKIRVISIYDELDSCEQIYKFDFDRLMKAIHEIKRQNPDKDKCSVTFQRRKLKLNETSKEKAQRYGKVINLYEALMPLDDICKATGFSIRQVNRILNKNHIQRDRYQPSKEKRI